MLFSFLLPIAIWTLPLLMLWLLYARSCRDYIEQRQPSARIVAPTVTDVGVDKTLDVAGAQHKGGVGIRSAADQARRGERRSREPRTFFLALPITALTRAA
jgi:hypothetical protein